MFDAHHAASAAEQLFAQGRPRDALHLLGDVRRNPARASADAQVLLTEVLVAMGYGDEAWTILLFLDRLPNLSKRHRARCECVRGKIMYLRGQLTEAARVCQLAVAMADQSGDLVQRARARLTLLNVATQVWSTEATDVLCRETLAATVRTGLPELLAQFYVEYARHQATRGNLHLAAKHLSRASALLDPSSQNVTAAFLHTVECALWQMASRPDLAEGAGTSALEAARACGSALFESSALANLAHFALKRGDFAFAERYASACLDMRDRSVNGTAALDTMAKLKLLQGNLDDCELLCREAEARLPVGNSRAPSWYEVDLFQTRIHLARRRRDWVQARELSAKAEEVALLRGDRLYATLYRALKLEASLKVGEANIEVDLLVDPPADLPLETIAEILRIRGSWFAALGQSALAAVAFERALVIHHVLQAAPARAETEAAYSETVAAHRTSTADPIPGEPGADDGPRRTGVDSRALCGGRIRQLADTPVSRASMFERLTGLLSHAAQPDIFGHDLLLLLVEQRAVRALALVRRPEGGRPEVVARAGWDAATAERKAGQPKGLVVIPLGPWHETPYELIVEPRLDVGSRLILAAAQRLADAARRLDAYRREDRARESIWSLDGFDEEAQGVFVSPEMIDLVKTARRVAVTTLPVLLTGETGTGKEVIARLIHRASPRAAKPFLAFNCTALPRELMESQLFGHRRGAFTGALETFAGLIRSAAGGTLFIDEIGELAVDLQPKLLRFLETNEIHPIGEARPVKVDVRIIAATNANLEKLMDEGRFREDLYYRLSVVRFRIPPLRERREEIPALVQHSVDQAAAEFRKGRPTVTDEAMEYLVLFRWPGNIRELANEMRRIVGLLEPDGLVTPAHLSPHILAARRTIAADTPRPDQHLHVRLDQPLPKVIEAVERLMIARALDTTGGHMDRAARLLGISRKGLFLKRRRWGLNVPASSPRA